MKTQARLMKEGQGGFLNPPTHPEHNFHVQHKFKKDGEFYMSLTGAIESDWIEDSIRERAQDLLNEWEKDKLPLDHEDIKDWIHQVLGYFRNCYSPDGEDRSVSNCKILDVNPFQLEGKMKETAIKRHLGILMIREYYPKYEPKADDFLNAYWGKKSEEFTDLFED